MQLDKQSALVLSLKDLGRENTDIVGGKSSSLGEMIAKLAGVSSNVVRVPGGFSTTALAYYQFLDENNIRTRINTLLAETDMSDISALAAAGEQCRTWIAEGVFSEAFQTAVVDQIKVLRARGVESVAVRSSATAEDLPDASFAGQQETLLNIPLTADDIFAAIKRVIGSLFGNRAIAYRAEHGYEHDKVALCACVQQMVRSDIGTAGVMFTSDSESGHTGVIGITAVYGLGETAVGGSNTAEFILGKPTHPGRPISILLRARGGQTEKMVYNLTGEGGHRTMLVPTTEDERARLCLTDSQLTELGQAALEIEQHYGMPMDIEWAFDGKLNQLFIVQARPITTNKASAKMEKFTIVPDGHRKIVTGLAVGTKVGVGRVRFLKDSSPEELAKVHPGDILVTTMTDPNFMPAMRVATAILTEQGSRKCHAAIVARELGKPCIVAATGVLEMLTEGDLITISCAEGPVGVVYEGHVPHNREEIEIGDMPELSVELKVNVGDPGVALQAAMWPNKGVGLAREELIVLNGIGVHPQACLDYAKLDDELQGKIRARVGSDENPRDFYIRMLAEGIALICRAFFPHRVIVRLSDFKTNEYRGLIGGDRYETEEANPMLGFRGAARYLDPNFAEAFRMECEAMLLVREMGLTNFDLMIPFIRTVSEGQRVKELLARNGLVSRPGDDGMRIGMMVEVPSNVVMAQEFAEFMDFGSIGSNDLTQLTLGADRDDGKDFGDERDPAVKRMIEMAIQAWRQAGKPIGICGQAPSDHEGYAEWLSDLQISSISLNPDTVVPVWRRIDAHHKPPQ